MRRAGGEGVRLVSWLDGKERGSGETYARAVSTLCFLDCLILEALLDEGLVLFSGG